MYEIYAETNRVASIDTTTVPGIAVVAAYSSSVTVRVQVAGSTPPPVFTAPPASISVAPGSTAVLNAAVTGATSYQWRRGNVDIPGATGPTLVLSGSSAIAGLYSVVASNAAGSTESTATLSIVGGSNFGRLINLSILTGIDAPGDSFTLGYVVGGAGTSGAKPLVIRAVAPSLAAAPFRLEGTLNDPWIELFAGSAKTGENVRR